MLNSLLNNPDLLIELEKPLAQQPPAGLFSFANLIWVDDWIQLPEGLRVVRKACIPTDRLVDLIDGVQQDTTEFSLYIRSSESKKAGSLKRPYACSFLVSQKYCCSFGPEDHRNLPCEVQDPASRPAQGKGSRRQREALGQSIKRGCQYAFCSKQLYKWPDVTEITLYNDQHCDETGLPCHGSEDSTAHNTRAEFCSRISSRLREWVTEQLRLGLTVQRIMSLHNKELAAKLEKGFCWRQVFGPFMQKPKVSRVTVLQVP